MIPMSVRPTADGQLSFNRPPRLDAPDPTAAKVSVAFPIEPTARERTRLPLITTIAPLIAGVALAAIMRRPEYLMFTVLSPLMMAGQWVSDRAGHRKATRSERARSDEALGKASRALDGALLAEALDRRRRAPDAATLLRTASGPSARLWERRRDDSDFLLLSLGSGNVFADVNVVRADHETSVNPW